MALSIGNDRNHSRMYRVGQNTTPNSVAFDNKKTSSRFQKRKVAINTTKIAKTDEFLFMINFNN